MNPFMENYNLDENQCNSEDPDLHSSIYNSSSTDNLLDDKTSNEDAYFDDKTSADICEDFSPRSEESSSANLYPEEAFVFNPPNILHDDTESGMCEIQSSENSTGSLIPLVKNEDSDKGLEAAVKLEQEFLDFMFLLGPNAADDKSINENTEAINSLRKNSTKPGLDYLDNLCKMIEHFSDLKKHNLKLQKRIKQLEEINNVSTITNKKVDSYEQNSDDSETSTNTEDFDLDDLKIETNLRVQCNTFPITSNFENLNGADKSFKKIDHAEEKKTEPLGIEKKLQITEWKKIKNKVNQDGKESMKNKLLLKDNEFIYDGDLRSKKLIFEKQNALCENDNEYDESDIGFWMKNGSGSQANYISENSDDNCWFNSTTKPPNPTSTITVKQPTNWDKVKQAFLSSAHQHKPYITHSFTSPTLNQCWTEGKNSEVSPAVEKIQKHLADVKNLAGMQSNLSLEFENKLHEWERIKSNHKLCEENRTKKRQNQNAFPAEFKKKLHEWEKIKLGTKQKSVSQQNVESAPVHSLSPSSVPINYLQHQYYQIFGYPDHKTKNYDEKSLPTDFRKKLTEWQIRKALAGKTDVSVEQLQKALGGDFNRKLHQWNRMKSCDKTKNLSSSAKSNSELVSGKNIKNFVAQAKIPKNLIADSPKFQSHHHFQQHLKEKLDVLHVHNQLKLDNMGKSKNKEIDMLEKKLMRIEQERDRLQKEKEKFVQQEARLEKVRNLMQKHSDQKKEVLIKTSTGRELRFEGINPKFTKKLLEWEQRRGIDPRISTFEFLDPNYTVHAKINSDVFEKLYSPKKLLKSRSESSLYTKAFTIKMKYDSEPLLCSLTNDSMKMVKNLNSQSCNIEAQKNFDRPNKDKISLTENNDVEQNAEEYPNLASTRNFDIFDNSMKSEIFENDINENTTAPNINYDAIVAQNMTLLNRLKMQENLCVALENQMEEIDTKMNTIADQHLKTLGKLHEQVNIVQDSEDEFTSNREGRKSLEPEKKEEKAVKHFPQESEAQRLINQLKIRINELEVKGNKLWEEKEEVEITFKLHKEQEHAIAKSLLDKINELEKSRSEIFKDEFQMHSFGTAENMTFQNEFNFKDKNSEAAKTVSQNILKRTSGEENNTDAICSADSISFQCPSKRKRKKKREYYHRFKENEFGSVSENNCDKFKRKPHRTSSFAEKRKLKRISSKNIKKLDYLTSNLLFQAKRMDGALALKQRPNSLSLSKNSDTKLITEKSRRNLKLRNSLRLNRENDQILMEKSLISPRSWSSSGAIASNEESDSTEKRASVYRGETESSEEILKLNAEISRVAKELRKEMTNVVRSRESTSPESLSSDSREYLLEDIKNSTKPKNQLKQFSEKASHQVFRDIQSLNMIEGNPKNKFSDKNKYKCDDKNNTEHFNPLNELVEQNFSEPFHFSNEDNIRISLMNKSKRIKNYRENFKNSGKVNSMESYFIPDKYQKSEKSSQRPIFYSPKSSKSKIGIRQEEPSQEFDLKNVKIRRLSILPKKLEVEKTTDALKSYQLSDAKFDSKVQSTNPAKNLTEKASDLSAYAQSFSNPCHSDAEIKFLESLRLSPFYNVISPRISKNSSDSEEEKQNVVASESIDNTSEFLMLAKSIESNQKIPTQSHKYETKVEEKKFNDLNQGHSSCTNPLNFSSLNPLKEKATVLTHVAAPKHVPTTHYVNTFVQEEAKFYTHVRTKELKSPPPRGLKMRRVSDTHINYANFTAQTLLRNNLNRLSANSCDTLARTKYETESGTKKNNNETTTNHSEDVNGTTLSSNSLSDDSAKVFVKTQRTVFKVSLEKLNEPSNEIVSRNNSFKNWERNVNSAQGFHGRKYNGCNVIPSKVFDYAKSVEQQHKYEIRNDEHYRENYNPSYSSQSSLAMSSKYSPLVCHRNQGRYTDEKKTYNPYSPFSNIKSVIDDCSKRITEKQELLGSPFSIRHQMNLNASIKSSFDSLDDFENKNSAVIKTPQDRICKSSSEVYLMRNSPLINRKLQKSFSGSNGNDIQNRFNQARQTNFRCPLPYTSFMNSYYNHMKIDEALYEDPFQPFECNTRNLSENMTENDHIISKRNKWAKKEFLTKNMPSCEKSFEENNCNIAKPSSIKHEEKNEDNFTPIDLVLSKSNSYISKEESAKNFERENIQNTVQIKTSESPSVNTGTRAKTKQSKNIFNKLKFKHKKENKNISHAEQNLEVENKWEKTCSPEPCCSKTIDDSKLMTVKFKSDKQPQISLNASLNTDNTPIYTSLPRTSHTSSLQAASNSFSTSCPASPTVNRKSKASQILSFGKYLFRNKSSAKKGKK